MAKRSDIINWCNQQLTVEQFKDYAPNGLQVEGGEEVNRIVCAVTASLAAIRYAADVKAQMLLVHHGLFWKSEPAGIVGWKKQRVRALLQHDLNLAGYHLPLDTHPQWGNNAQLAKHMGWYMDAQIGEQNLLSLGSLPQAVCLADLTAQLDQTLQRKPLLLANDPRKTVHRLAWCSGGGQGFFQAAIDAGAEVFITGEVSEAQYHLALENDVAFIAAGHHATERFGVQALAAAISEEFQVPVSFFDEKNPV
ncbi:Nif3-like dinuclear metal center hexameric protein [Stenoxybacter acetivorans]|uniref:Nif3-like dinuclear metal center hexameric protein n=1 Tax=Stenoxybacter acetivorans TaxID=422441 RepID=UPI00056B82D0|nr:Nif3-like dinuclear metal center hexameric protein [Stenoxybacter acetivorans]